MKAIGFVFSIQVAKRGNVWQKNLERLALTYWSPIVACMAKKIPCMKERREEGKVGVGIVERDDVQGPSNIGGEMRLLLREQLGQAEISDFGFQVAVQKNVAGFDVSMNDARRDFVVQIRQSSRRS